MRATIGPHVKRFTNAIARKLYRTLVMIPSRLTLEPAQMAASLRRIERPCEVHLQPGFDALSRAFDVSARDARNAGVSSWSTAEREALQRVAVEVASARDRGWTVVDAYESDGAQYVVVRCGAAASPEQRAWATLSDREREVAAAAATGSSNKQIAFELGLAHSTVRVLCHRAMQKLRVSSRQQLIERVCALGCIVR